MFTNRSQEALEGDAIVQVFAGMNFEAQVDAYLFEGVRMGFPRRRHSPKASSIRPAGRCGQG